MLSPDSVLGIEQRVALLRQRERELLMQFSQAHATRTDIDAIAEELFAIAEQIADLETMLPRALAKAA